VSTSFNSNAFSPLLLAHFPVSMLSPLPLSSNQFGGQEPGSNAEIKAFARGKGAKFDIFAKIDVNGPDTHPVYQKLKSGAGNKTLFSVLGGE
jgi:glutathione peroxidase-family protein